MGSSFFLYYGNPTASHQACIPGGQRSPSSPNLLLRVPSVPQEALRKIITTLAMKNEETQTFIYSLKQMLLNVEVNSLLLSADVGAGERPGGTPLSAGGLSMPWFPRLHRVSLCSSCWPKTCSVEQAGLELTRDSPCLCLPRAGAKTCITAPAS